MANKKCPKCGEDNPAEAVMCWACYTPLSGAAPLTASAAALPATAGVAGRPGPGMDAGANEKKDLDPKIIGVVALFLIAAVIGGVVMFTGGGSPDTGSVTEFPTTQPVADPGVGAGGGPPVVIPPLPPVSPPQGVPPTGVTVLPYQTVAQPNPQWTTGTVGILATQPNLSSQQAIGLAKFARQQFMANGRWKNMQVAVFTNAQSARAFQQYQAGRKNGRLSSGDYQALAQQGVWTGTAAYYETIGSREYPYYPSKSPNGWWGR